MWNALKLCAAIIVVVSLSAAAPAEDKSSKEQPLTGTWECVSHGGQRSDTKFTLGLQQDGEKVTGSVESDEGGMDISSATFKDGALEIRLETPDGAYVLAAKLTDGQLSGTITLDGKDNGTWEGRKAAPAKP